LNTEEKGNVLFIILIAIALFAALSYAVTQSSQQPGHFVEDESLSLDIAQLLTHANSIRSVVHNMIANGVDPANISTLKAGDAGFDTSPHNTKIYHPYGGGISYTTTTGKATGILIHDSLTIVDVGTGSAELVFIARIPNETYCQQINNTLNDSPVVPTVIDITATGMLAGTATALIDVGSCPANGCNAVPHQCVQNVIDPTEFIYYHTLYAR